MVDREYWNQQVESCNASQDRLDEWLLKLSSGALVFALGLARTYSEPLQAWALFGAWGGFALCACSVLFSFRSSRQAAQLQIARMREEAVRPAIACDAERGSDLLTTEPGGRPEKITAVLNWTSLGAFLLGVLLLGYFVGLNMQLGRSSVSDNMKALEPSSTTQAPRPDEQRGRVTVGPPPAQGPRPQPARQPADTGGKK